MTSLPGPHYYYKSLGSSLNNTKAGFDIGKQTFPGVRTDFDQIEVMKFVVERRVKSE